jgi:diaminopimelate epimerase
MLLFNADGSPAETSGNGLRVLAHYLYQNGLVRSRKLSLFNDAGENRVEVISGGGDYQLLRIAMEPPRFELEAVPMRGATSHFINAEFRTASGVLLGTAVNVGNPHIVFFVDNPDFDWQTYGAEVECDPRFPQRTNVEFAIIRSRRRLSHWSWERGVGPTRASGTGAASAVAAGVINGLLGRNVIVSEPAGDLRITIKPPQNEILLTGPSQKVGEGVFFYPTT